MPCDTRLKANQTIQERATEVRAVVAKLDSLIASGRVKIAIGPQGAVAFSGVPEADRDGVTDACAYRRLLVQGSALAKVAIQRAELLAGRSIDRKVVANGHHSHDGGKTWHGHKG